jgi:hypothetical protein
VTHPMTRPKASAPTYAIAALSLSARRSRCRIGAEPIASRLARLGRSDDRVPPVVTRSAGRTASHSADRVHGAAGKARIGGFAHSSPCRRARRIVSGAAIRIAASRPLNAAVAPESLHRSPSTRSLVPTWLDEINAQQTCPPGSRWL